MDFSQAYFNGNQPYQYMANSPMTPSTTAASDDFGHQQSPHAMYEFQSHDQFQPSFDQFTQFNPHQSMPGPPGPPTPPTMPMHGQSLNDSTRPQGSNSDEDDLSPAQSRRKAQNRAAQRAFRERKERHVKDLEAKLASLEAAQSQTATENEKLKREMQKMSTENEILRATSNAHAQHAGATSLPGADMTTGPMQYSPDDFYSHLLQGHANKTRSHRIVESGGQRLLAAGATWDYIINHDLFKKGLVDVGDVCDRLKAQVKCDGQGPVFEERFILQAIIDSAGGSSDELL